MFAIGKWWAGTSMTIRAMLILIAGLYVLQLRHSGSTSTPATVSATEVAGSGKQAAVGGKGFFYDGNSVDPKEADHAHPLVYFSTPPRPDLTGKQVCMQCSGAGWFNCAECSGSGCGAPAIRSTIMCPTCLGAGCTRCPSCKGFGGWKKGAK